MPCLPTRSPRPARRVRALPRGGNLASQCEVAGVSALLLAAGAEPGDVRALLGRMPARWRGRLPTSCGSGLVDVQRSLERLEHGHVPELPVRFVNPIVTLVRDSQAHRRGMAFVEVVDENNDPVRV